MTDTAGNVFSYKCVFISPKCFTVNRIPNETVSNELQNKKKYKQHEAQRKHKENMAEVHVNTVVAQCEKI